MNLNSLQICKAENGFYVTYTPKEYTYASKYVIFNTWADFLSWVQDKELKGYTVEEKV